MYTDPPSESDEEVDGGEVEFIPFLDMDVIAIEIEETDDGENDN